MTRLDPGSLLLCYNCQRSADGTCDFQRTALDRCGRPCCDNHGRSVFGGRLHICMDHDHTMDLISQETKAAKARKAKADDGETTAE